MGDGRAVSYSAELSVFNILLHTFDGLRPVPCSFAFGIGKGNVIMREAAGVECASFDPQSHFIAKHLVQLFKVFGLPFDSYRLTKQFISCKAGEDFGGDGFRHWRQLGE